MDTTHAKPKFLLISDLDGTLLNSQYLVSVQNQQAIHRLLEAGGVFAIASGRATSSVLRFAGPLGARYGAVVNGAILYDFYENKIVAAHHLPESSKNFVEQLAVSFPEVGVQVYTDFNAYTLQYNAVISNKGVPEEYSGLLTPRGWVPDGWCKLILTGEPERMEEIKCLVETAYPGLCAFLSGHHFCEITANGIDKGLALQGICRFYGISLGQVAAIGDGENDLPMLCIAGLSMAVDSGMNRVKKKVDHVVPGNNYHPMVDAVDLALARFGT